MFTRDDRQSIEDFIDEVGAAYGIDCLELWETAKRTMGDEADEDWFRDKIEENNLENQLRKLDEMDEKLKHKKPDHG